MVGGLRGDSSGDAHRNLNQLRKPFNTLIVLEDLREGLGGHTASGLLKKGGPQPFCTSLVSLIWPGWPVKTISFCHFLCYSSLRAVRALEVPLGASWQSEVKSF